MGTVRFILLALLFVLINAGGHELEEGRKLHGCHSSPVNPKNVEQAFKKAASLVRPADVPRVLQEAGMDVAHLSPHLLQKQLKNYNALSFDDVVQIAKYVDEHKGDSSNCRQLFVEWAECGGEGVPRVVKK